MKTIITIALLLVSFIYGILVGYAKYPPYNFLSYVKNQYLDISVNKNQKKILEDCEITSLSEVSNNSIVFIGHAYGAPGHGEFLSPKVVSFLNKNKNKIERVVFTGDVLREPSKEKWKRLNDYMFSNQIKFSIAPGNHDIGFNDNAYRDIFFKIFDKSFPYVIKSVSNQKTKIVIEDSTKNNWMIMNKSFEFINQDNKNINYAILLRHNIPVSELLKQANSTEGLGYRKLPSINELSKKFKRKVIVISGDSGAEPSLSRISCIKKNKLTVIANGIGNLDNDIILILNNNKLGYLNLKESLE